jgi:hypothetical protein
MITDFLIELIVQFAAGKERAQAEKGSVQPGKHI